MKEVAFRVKKGSELYESYFAASEEKDKFVRVAHEFFVKRGIADGGKYRLSPNLCLELNPEQKERFKTQLKKYCDSDGLYCFKRRSKMQAAWESEVISQVNLRVLDAVSLWFWPYISKGRQSLWNYEGELYGYLSSNTDIKLSEDMEPMKLSEYYAIAEEVQYSE